MLLVSMIGLLFLFSLIGMEIAWAIGIACFGYLVLSNIAGDGTPMVLFAQQMTVGVDAFVLLAIRCISACSCAPMSGRSQ